MRKASASRPRIHGAIFFLSTWMVLQPGPASSQSPSPAFPSTLTTPPLDILSADLKSAVHQLAERIGERNLDRKEKLDEARDWIHQQWESQGLRPRLLPYPVNGVSCSNIEVDVTRSVNGPLVVVGAHYDSVKGTPGADDNASGVAVMLEISKALAGVRTRRPVRCVAFVNEEPPYFESDAMGSRVYARALRKSGTKVFEMLSIECVGYYSDSEDSQRYPPLLAQFYPGVGNFIGVVGSLHFPDSVFNVSRQLKAHSTVPVETATLPPELPGVSWSDHASFWLEGYPGVMVTDTAPFRNPDYHHFGDVPASLDYDRMARLTTGLIRTVHEVANAPDPVLDTASTTSTPSSTVTSH